MCTALRMRCFYYFEASDPGASLESGMAKVWSSEARSDKKLKQCKESPFGIWQPGLRPEVLAGCPSRKKHYHRFIKFFPPGRLLRKTIHDMQIFFIKSRSRLSESRSRLTISRSRLSKSRLLSRDFIRATD